MICVMMMALCVMCYLVNVLMIHHQIVSLSNNQLSVPYHYLCDGLRVMPPKLCLLA